MTAKQAKLEALKNRATRYELVLTHGPSGKRLRLCYTSRNNRRGLIDAVQRNGEELVKRTGFEQFKAGCGQPPSATLGS